MSHTTLIKVYIYLESGLAYNIIQNYCYVKIFKDNYVVCLKLVDVI